MRRACIVGLTLGCLALPALAQPGLGPRNMDDPGMHGGRGGPGNMSVGMMAERLADELGLDEAQRAKLEAIAEQYRGRGDEMREQREQRRALIQEYRAARENGDEARAEEIRAALRDFGGGRRALMREFFEEVETILDESQIPALHQFRERIQQHARRGADMRRTMESLPEELDLTDEQRAKFDELMAEHQASRGEMRERWQELRPLLEAMREARAAGDEERAAQLQAELEEKRPHPPRLEDLLEQLKPMLTEEQKAKLAALQEESFGPQERPGNLRHMLRAAKRLDLNPEQQEQLKKIIDDAKPGRAHRTRKEEAEIAKTVKQQVLEMLDADQKTEFERLLERGQRPGRPDRPGRGEGGRRGHGHHRHGEGARE